MLSVLLGGAGSVIGDLIIIAIANMDEFACGGSGETSAFGPAKNPVAPELIPGGTSSGSAASVSAGFCDFALGSDTGGSIRNPASHCGVIGIKPSYALVSRYGLIDMGMSFDQIGVLAKDVEDTALLLDIIKGRDEKDPIPNGVKIVAYEPVAAIGTGQNESPEQTVAMKKKMNLPKDCIFIYGGSVNEKNAGEYFATGEIDGFLIGKSCLDPKQFIEIARAAQK